MKLFGKRTNQKEVAVATKTVKSTADIVAEIHETFFTEVDRLLADAKIMMSAETTMGDLIDKRNRLIALGFTATKEVFDATNEIDRLSEIEKENSEKRELAKAIGYFSIKYPNYKFITEKSVKRICEKYGLVYGPAHKYIGTVPDKNLGHMEKFEVKDEDRCCESFYEYFSRGGGDVFGYEVISHSTYKRYQTLDTDDRGSSGRYVYRVMPTEIAAPAKDFNLSGSEIKNLKVVDKPAPDPVVLQPVFFEGSKHYLIVTAWGPEAGDVDVINEKMN